MKRIAVGTVMVVYMTVFSFSLWTYQHPVLTSSDQSKLLPTRVKQIRSATSTNDLKYWVAQAKQRQETVSVAGMQHSQGGQTYLPDTTVLDMTDYDRILEYTPDKHRITVQSGITWAEIQDRIQPDGLAVQVMQSQNIFTVGGALSVNVHGRDIRYGSLLDTVDSFRLLKADGTVVHVSRNENADLFRLVPGGYGLFGIILDVTLKLTDDEWYTEQTVALDYHDYPAYFRQHVLGDADVRMHIGRISVAPDGFFKEMYVTNYHKAERTVPIEEEPLKQETIIALPKALLGLSRYSDFGKNKLWSFQKSYFLKQSGTYESRNNVMRSDSAFMEYTSPGRTELLQEYFVPVDSFVSYVDQLRSILTAHELNVLNITIRYVEQDRTAALSYAKQDMFALVWLINTETDPVSINETKRIVQKLIDATLEHQGSYYLPYYPFATRDQFTAAYPNAAAFKAAKQRQDPKGLFMNQFYLDYLK
ncbi:MAG TPA: FAD-binding oxidoreductase [Exiguobacterium sp.]|uniref:FAD-binding oxidoreductase n=1 Tax=Exiguobacterium sp. TaxID=44751 RepID=UPI000ECC9F6C|nr:FAD-binding oxidoreductase [Exiguobacterium sp.]HCN59006.1 FAD-binding oxidoreductase [Exiguobacterium sp.]